MSQMSLADFWSWVEMQPLSEYVGGSAWFPFLESLHVITVTFVVGSMLMADLRLLGWAARRYSARAVIGQILPWTWGAFTLSFITGVGMFITRASAYADNPAFQIKLVLIALAGINATILHNAAAGSHTNRDIDPSSLLSGRIAGASSFLLWAMVLLAGRWIGHLQ
jgi:Family of unknown function (DUF6644)